MLDDHVYEHRCEASRDRPRVSVLLWAAIWGCVAVYLFLAVLRGHLPPAESEGSPHRTRCVRAVVPACLSHVVDSAARADLLVI